MLESTISVILSTKDRVASLRRCLESLQSCRIPSGWKVEVLVVDNGSNRETRAAVASLSKCPAAMEMTYLYEPRRGKTFAVNRGVVAAKGEIFAFVDDDVSVDSKWLGEIIKEFNRDRSLCLLAGRVEPTQRTGRLVAVTRGMERIGLNDLPSLEGLILGCNLAIRPAVLSRVKGRDTRLGPGRGLSCEDIDFTYRVLRSGYRGVFMPTSIVYHDPGERDRRREYLRGWGAFYIKFLLAGDRKVARQAWWKLHAISKRFWAGDYGSACDEAWHLMVGASIMAARMAVSRSSYN